MRKRYLLLITMTVILINTGETLAQWVQTNGTGQAYIECFASVGGDLFAGSYGGGLFESTDGGANWTQVNSNWGTGIWNGYVYSLAVSSTQFVAGTDVGVFRSSDTGANWTLTNTGVQPAIVLALAAVGSNVFAGTYGSGVYVANDSGFNWSSAGSGIGNGDINTFLVLGTEILAGTGAGVYISADDGATWNKAGSMGAIVQTIAAKINGTGETRLFAGTLNNGVYLSTDGGSDWTQTTLSDIGVFSLAVSGSDVFAGTANGVFLSSDDGTSWRQVNTGLADTSVQSLFVSGATLFAGTYEAGIWKRPLSEMITAVKSAPGDYPKGFALSQNYPNPFNPSTVITYELPVRSDVTLKVYDVLGREVRILVNGNQNAGEHSVTFDGSNLPSGVYFYRIRAGTYFETRKLTILK